jgi:hypothetical protein
MDFLRLASLCHERYRSTPPDGAALTYARRYALFALVGIAGEDELDAPDILPTPRAVEPRTDNGTKRRQDKIILQRPTLSRDQSSELKHQMLVEIGFSTTENDLLVWAKNGLPRKKRSARGRCPLDRDRLSTEAPRNRFSVSRIYRRQRKYLSVVPRRIRRSALLFPRSLPASEARRTSRSCEVSPV